MLPQDALKVAQDFVGFVESRDREGIARSLADDVQQIFVMSGGEWQRYGAIYDGKAEVLDYTYGLFGKFDTIAWVEKDWTASADGRRVFLQAYSDCVVSHSKARYRNTYVMRFDVADGQITKISEYAVGEFFLATGIPFEPHELKAVARAGELSGQASV